MIGRRPRLALAATALLAAAGCGLVPTPNWLDGRIADGTYTAASGDFSVRVPFTDSYELTYMAAKDRSNDDETYVSFGPAAFDKSIYRLSVYRRTVVPLPDAELRAAAERLGRELGEQLQAMTGEPLIVADRGDAAIGDGRAHRMQYRQAAPAGTVATDAATILHESWTVQRGDRLYWVWLQTYEWGVAGPESTAIGARAFAESVRFAGR